MDVFPLKYSSVEDIVGEIAQLGSEAGTAKLIYYGILCLSLFS